jgi:hypothetical protein
LFDYLRQFIELDPQVLPHDRATAFPQCQDVIAFQIKPRIALTQLWDILDEPQLNRALGNKQNARINLWLKKPPAR